MIRASLFKARFVSKLLKWRNIWAIQGQPQKGMFSYLCQWISPALCKPCWHEAKGISSCCPLELWSILCIYLFFDGEHKTQRPFPVYFHTMQVSSLFILHTHVHTLYLCTFPSDSSSFLSLKGFWTWGVSWRLSDLFFHKEKDLCMIKGVKQESVSFSKIAKATERPAHFKHNSRSYV